MCALCRAPTARARAAGAELRPLYAGLGPAAVETVASTVVYFWLYSLLKQAAVDLSRRRGGGGKFGVGASLLVAAAAGAGNMLVTTPAQVVTTHMMANSKLKQGLARAGRPAAHVPCDAVDVCREIAARDGVGGFWRGVRRARPHGCV